MLYKVLDVIDILQCTIVQYMGKEDYKGFLVFSQTKVIILRFFQEDKG